jgi:predicted DNA-binding protein
MGYSEAQILGLVEKTEDVQVTEQAALTNANLNAAKMHEELLALHRKANASNELQEKKKRELKEITEQHVMDLKQLYVAASSQLDMMIGAVKKNSVAAKNFRRIRSRLKRQNADDIVVAQPVPQPVPTPVPLK